MSEQKTKNTEKQRAENEQQEQPKLTRLSVRSNLKAGRAGCQPCHRPS